MNFLQKTTRKVLSPAGQKIIHLVLCGIFSWSCALLPKTTVTFQPDNHLTKMFESAEVPPGYTYFYFGPEAAPSAILGMNPQYQFQQSLWKKIDLSSEKLKAWTEYLDVTHRFGPHYYAASHIIDGQGNKIGIWYSSHHWATVKVNPEGVIAVFPPDEHRVGVPVGSIFRYSPGSRSD